VGVVEFACTEQSAARKRWEILTRMTPEIGASDHPYPTLALFKLNPDEARTQARRTLNFLQRQLDGDQPDHLGELYYSQGLLLMMLGRDGEAAESFRAGVAAGPPGLVEYLNLDAARLLTAQ
jgi:hypothetical protein